AGTAEAGCGRGGRAVDDEAVAGLARLLQREAVDLDRAAEVRAAVREDREARRRAAEAVVSDVRGATGHLALFGVEQEGRGHELVLGEVVDGADVDLGVALL